MANISDIEFHIMLQGLANKNPLFKKLFHKAECEWEKLPKNIQALALKELGLKIEIISVHIISTISKKKYTLSQIL